MKKASAEKGLLCTRIIPGLAILAAITTFSGGACHAGTGPGVDGTTVNPSGDSVEVILTGVDVYTGLSADPSTADPPSYGYPVLEEETYFEEGGQEWVSRMYITRDMEAIRDALANGGMITLNPGVYNWNARTVYSQIMGGGEVFQYTSMMQYDRDYLAWVTALDYHLKGAGKGPGDPSVKVVCDFFIHIGADPDWATTGTMPTQVIENVHFDNSEWLEYNYAQGVFDNYNTLLGWHSQADITVKGCKFTGGGVTFHNWGKVTFAENVMENTFYGVDVTYPACTSFIVTRNKITTVSGEGIWCQYNVSSWWGMEPATIEIVGNEVEWAGLAGIGVWYTDGMVSIHHNKVTSSPGIFPNSFGYYAGIGCWDCMKGALLMGNEVTGNSDLPNVYALNLGGTSDSIVQSNKVSGPWMVPVTLDWYETPANSNVLIGNNLNDADAISGFHYMFDYTDYNVVRGGGVAGHNIVVLDNGLVAGSNLVTGLDHRIGQLTLEEPYTSMKEAMKDKFPKPGDSQ